MLCSWSRWWPRSGRAEQLSPRISDGKMWKVLMKIKYWSNKNLKILQYSCWGIRWKAKPEIRHKTVCKWNKFIRFLFCLLELLLTAEVSVVATEDKVIASSYLADFCWGQEMSLSVRSESRLLVHFALLLAVSPAFRGENVCHLWELRTGGGHLGRPRYIVFTCSQLLCSAGRSQPGECPRQSGVFPVSRPGQATSAPQCVHRDRHRHCWRLESVLYLSPV